VRQNVAYEAVGRDWALRANMEISDDSGVRMFLSFPHNP
jgi:hypothetical protein